MRQERAKIRIFRKLKALQPHLLTIFYKKEGYFKPFVVLILENRKIEKPFLFTAGGDSIK